MLLKQFKDATPKPTVNPANIARGDTVKWVGGSKWFLASESEAQML
jgi:hypothetical protein